MEKKRIKAGALLPPLFFAAFLGLGQQTPPPEKEPQNVNPAKRPATDYMRLLSQSTKPIGIRTDESLQRLNRQPTIAWAVRAARRHILD
jgi:hypothetical protein